MKIVYLDINNVTNGDIDIEKLKTLGETELYDFLSKEEILRVTKEADMVICNKSVIDNEVIENAKNLKYIGLFATGYNNIDIESAKAHNITVCNVAGYSTSAVSQLVFTFMLYFSGNTEKFISSVKNGDWKKSKTFSYFPFEIQELKDKTIGIFGYGSIGKRTAEIAKAFEMKVLICTRTKPENCQYEIVNFDTLLQESDFITLHCPLNEQTTHLINKNSLSKMKKNCLLINTSRGGVINEEDLYNALKDKQIKGACLDVLDKEPMAKDQKLHTLDNCLITPHIAWAGKETRQRLVDEVALNIEAFFKNKTRNKIV